MYLIIKQREKKFIDNSGGKGSIRRGQTLSTSKRAAGIKKTRP